MKKYIAFKKLGILTICIYVFTYLFYSFVTFEFCNPFKWIINIPTYEKKTRAILLGYWIIYYIVAYWIILQHIKNKE